MGTIASQITRLASVYSAVFRQRSKKTSKLCVTGLCAGNSPETGEFPTQRASNAENVSIWWRHHGINTRSFAIWVCGLQYQASCCLVLDPCCAGHLTHQSSKMSYWKISRSLDAMRLGIKTTASLWIWQTTRQLSIVQLWNHVWRLRDILR